MKKPYNTNVRSAFAAFALISLLTTFAAQAAKTPEEVSRARHYPACYCSGAETREEIDALVEELWHKESPADTKIWPEGKIPLKAGDAPIKVCEDELWQRNLVVTDVNVPYFRFFPASGEGAKPVVVVMPGGGYIRLGLNKEGSEIAEWLNSLGFSAAVLVYRAPNQREAALCDAQRTIGLLRRDAAKYSIDPCRVGVIGFSAGANLTVRIATNWRKRLYSRVDDADDFSCRPDFHLPIYPWDLRARKNPSNPWKDWVGMELRPEYPVDSETPPAFIVQAIDDFCEVETSVAYDWKLRQSGVESTVKIYPDGGHGYGLRRTGKSVDTWSSEAAVWLGRFARPQKKVLFLGDSITDAHHIGCTKNYWGFLADRYGFKPLVYGINGQQWSDIGAQAKKYKSEHPECPDVIFVFAGTNDFNSDTPLGEWYSVSDAKVNKNGREVVLKKREFSFDRRTLRGRINSAMSYLKDEFPTARLVILSPVHRGYATFAANNVQPDESYANALGLFIDDYVAVVKEAGNVWAAKVVDLNADSGLYPVSRAQDAYFSNAERDRLHPSSAGHVRIAEAISLAVGDLLK